MDDLLYQDVINDFVDKMKSVGIELNQDEIHYRGFGSQGDGASFDFKLLTLKEVSKFLKEIEFTPSGGGDIDYILNTHFEAFDIYTSKNSFSTHYCHEKTRNININHQCKVGHYWDQLIKEANLFVIDWYCGECVKLYNKLEERFHDILEHEEESERLDLEMTISDKIDSMIDPEMNIEKVIEIIKEANIVSSSYEEEEELILKFKENFNKEYRIIKKG